MDCDLCKVGTTTKGVVLVTLEKGNSIILIKDVPADVCSNCGHYYLSEEITAEVLQKGNEAVANGAELEVIKLKVAS
ncbi:type II toxin-antitoxin system MqsA family antitoxin [uncultured Mucilaginibacter sp.]|uniref:type II toxin-antitoxin system MqsA family antitoxin n=1 Tax=uncultured Mucilaginibacter sp. TaxID=797541 RepID=UPI0025DBCF1A|nr:type II toxin-antitoxin system MqsA family antitoxin [uncultured Mucilaginibacter sp.]